MSKGENLYNTEGHGRWGGIVGDAVLGANDGIITTFAIVAGITGANLSASVVLIIGVASLIADGISMALGNYLGTKSERDFVKSERKREEWEVEHKPEEETGEIRQIFKDKGFEGEDLERAVKIITSDKKRWVNTMMQDELNLPQETSFNPLRSAGVIFIFFFIFGSLPMLVYIPIFDIEQKFLFTSVLAAIAIFLMGIISGFMTKKNAFLNGIEMVLIGLISGVSAYLAGALISRLVGTFI